MTVRGTSRQCCRDAWQSAKRTLPERMIAHHRIAYHAHWQESQVADRKSPASYVSQCKEHLVTTNKPCDCGASTLGFVQGSADAVIDHTRRLIDNPPTPTPGSVGQIRVLPISRPVEWIKPPKCNVHCA